MRAFCFCDGTAVSRGDAVICQFDASVDAKRARRIVAGALFRRRRIVVAVSIAADTVQCEGLGERRL